MMYCIQVIIMVNLILLHHLAYQYQVLQGQCTNTNTHTHTHTHQTWLHAFHFLREEMINAQQPLFNIPGIIQLPFFGRAIIMSIKQFELSGCHL